jgi:hypothetical protein
MLLGLGVMATLAIRDPSFAVEADYYQKAVHWDDRQAQAAENQRLAYRLNLPLGVRLDASGRGLLRVEARDAAGRLLGGAKLRAEAFAVAYSAQLSQLELKEVAPGVYEGPITATHSGLWELRFTLQSGSERFTQVLRRDLSLGGGP